jgi:hypothetical protein
MVEGKMEIERENREDQPTTRRLMFLPDDYLA